jgi:nucleoside-diphosphate-sugar epimerase
MEVTLKVIITGATGFIGRNLSESFHKEGVEVVAIGRSEYVGKALQQNGIKFILANVEDQSQVNRAFCPGDYVIHCAGRAGDWWTYRDFYKANVAGTRNVINACRRNDINKIIYTSTSSVYLNGADRYNIQESEPLPEQRFNYGKTKLVAEKELLKLKEEGLKTIVLRPRAVYGKYDQNVVSRFLRLADKKSLPLINGGRALVDITYMGNLTSAVRNCFAAPDDAWNEIYNVSNGSPVTLKEWISQVLEVFDKPFKPEDISEAAAKRIAAVNGLVSILPSGNKRPELTKYSVEYMGKSMTLSIEKAKEKLQYLPSISNQEGFKHVRKWHMENQ